MACTDQGTFTVPSEFPLSVLLHVEHSFNPSCERAMSTNVLQYISNPAKVISIDCIHTFRMLWEYFCWHCQM